MRTNNVRRKIEKGGRDEWGDDDETYFACFRLRAIIFSAISVGIGAASFSL
jgi:hypothetical protein